MAEINWDSELQTYQQSIDRLRSKKNQVDELQKELENTTIDKEQMRMKIVQLESTLHEIQQQFTERTSRLEGTLRVRTEQYNKLQEKVAQEQEIHEKNKEKQERELAECRSTLQAKSAALSAVEATCSRNTEQHLDEKNVLEKNLDEMRKEWTETQQELSQVEAFFGTRMHGVQQAAMERERDLVSQLRHVRNQCSAAEEEKRTLTIKVEEIMKTSSQQSAVVLECSGLLERAKKDTEATVQAYAAQLAWHNKEKICRRKEDANTVQTVLEMQDRVDVLRIEQKEQRFEMARLSQWNERLQLEKEDGQASFRVQAQERQDDMGRMVLLVESQNHYRVQNKSQKAELQQHQVLLERIHTEKAILVTQLSTLQDRLQAERDERAQWAAARRQLLVDA